MVLEHTTGRSPVDEEALGTLIAEQEEIFVARQPGSRAEHAAVGTPSSRHASGLLPA